jgi:hypothetical protein
MEGRGMITVAFFFEKYFGICALIGSVTNATKKHPVATCWDGPEFAC